MMSDQARRNYYRKQDKHFGCFKYLNSPMYSLWSHSVQEPMPRRQTWLLETLRRFPPDELNKTWIQIATSLRCFKCYRQVREYGAYNPQLLTYKERLNVALLEQVVVGQMVCEDSHPYRFVILMQPKKMFETREERGAWLKAWNEKYFLQLLCQHCDTSLTRLLDLA